MGLDIVEKPKITTQRVVPPKGTPTDSEDPVLKDPVCGMSVTARSPHMTVHAGSAVYFCSAGCQTKFLANPAKYSGVPDGVHPSAAPAAKTESNGTIYTSRERKLGLEKATSFESIAGAGVRGTLGNRQINVGNTALMAQVGVSVDELKSQAEQLRAEGASVMYLSADGKLAGLLSVSDPIKANTAEALAALKASGIRVIMASGDGLTTAKSVAAKLGIDDSMERSNRRISSHSSISCSMRGALWPWPAMASTMHRRSPKRMSVSPWARARMWL